MVTGTEAYPLKHPLDDIVFSERNYLRWRRVVCGFVRSICNGVPYSEDLVQDFFDEAWRSRHRYDFKRRGKGENAIKNWLFGIIRHKMNDILRSWGRHRVYPMFSSDFSFFRFDGNEETSGSDGVVTGDTFNADYSFLEVEDAPGSGVEQRDISAYVREEVFKLPEMYSLPLMLHHGHGWNCNEIADLMGIPVGTVKSHLSIGRDKLKERLQKRNGELVDLLT